jgi:hypothetical protein
VADDIMDRFGEAAAQTFVDQIKYGPGLEGWSYGSDQDSVSLLRGIPTPLFLDALEHALELLRRVSSGEWEVGGFVPVGINHINEVFEKRGIHYRFNEEGRAEWHGDAGTYQHVIAPTLAALGNPALAGCRTEFDDALANLRRRTPKELEDAIEEAAKSVESAMKVVLAEHGVPFDKETAEPLWTLLRDNSIVPTPTKDAILAASRLRNPMGGHGTGASPREIPAGIPELAVQSAASAITYLAGLLPP